MNPAEGDRIHEPGRHDVSIVVSWLFIVLAVSACTPKQPEESVGGILSSQQLIQAGYYAYVLPEEIEASLDWQGSLYMQSFDLHCAAFSSSQPFNPVNIRYRNGTTGASVFSIDISPFDRVLDRSLTASEIPLTLEWSNDGVGNYQITENGGTILLFKDVFGMDVVISSSLPIDQVTSIVSQLEYVGPEPTTVNNPWLDACEE